MTITIEPPADMTETLTVAAAREGLTLEAFALHAALERARSLGQTTEAPLPKRSTLRDFAGIVDGTSGPGDGRAWSEIEAACDPFRPSA